MRHAALAGAREARVRARPQILLEPRRVARADRVTTEGRGGRGGGFAIELRLLLCCESFRLSNALRRGRPTGASTARFHGFKFDSFQRGLVISPDLYA